MKIQNEKNLEELTAFELISLRKQLFDFHEKERNTKESFGFRFTETVSYNSGVVKILEPYRDKFVYWAKYKDEKFEAKEKPTYSFLAGLSFEQTKAKLALIDIRYDLVKDALLAISIKELLEKNGVNCGIASLLNDFFQYDPEHIPDSLEWLRIDEIGFWKVLLLDNKIVFPDEMGDDNESLARYLNFHDYFPIVNEAGLYGLARNNGELIKSCDVAYISGRHSAIGSQDLFFEYSDQNPPVLCDLADQTWKKINPENVKIIPKSSLLGPWAVVDTVSGIEGLRGFMNFKGELIGERRWHRVGRHRDVPSLAAVQDDKTGLNGYVNEYGDVVIKPKYLEAWVFNYERAVVVTDEGAGVITPSGELVIKPSFRRINPLKKGYFVVEDFDLKLAVFDINGLKALNFQEWPHDEDITGRIFENLRSDECDDLKAALDASRHESWPDEIRNYQEYNPANLGIVETLPEADCYSICHRLLWGNKVELIEPFNRMEKGDRGLIKYYYPVTSGDFDYTEQTPVMFDRYSETVFGVPWHLLKLVVD